MGDVEQIIKVQSPKREWLLRCDGEDDDVFSIEVNRGAVELFMPDGADRVHLERSQIAAFREALDEAVAQAEADLRAVLRAEVVT